MTKDKHSSLFCLCVNVKLQKRFIDTRGLYHKNFTVAIREIKS
jgi:hypothetical protein